MSKKNIFYILIILIILAFISFFASLSNRQLRLFTFPPTPTPIPVSNLNIRSLNDFVEKSTLPTDKPLTDSEQSFQSANPQTFSGRDITKTGTLIVTSEIDSVHVLIDTQFEEGSSSTASDLPANLTPFKFENIPAGNYSIIADKEGYIWKYIEILIEPNKITRLNIHLDPANYTNQ